MPRAEYAMMLAENSIPNPGASPQVTLPVGLWHYAVELDGLFRQEVAGHMSASLALGTTRHGEAADLALPHELTCSQYAGQDWVEEHLD